LALLRDEAGDRPRPGPESTNLERQGVSGFGEIEQAVALVQFRRQCNLSFVLLRVRRRAGLALVERFEQQRRRQLREPVVELAGGFQRTDVGCGLGQDIASVDLLG